MGMFLNSRYPFEAYRAAASEKFFVDKTELLAELIPALGKTDRLFVSPGQDVSAKVLWLI